MSCFLPLFPENATAFYSLCPSTFCSKIREGEGRDGRGSPSEVRHRHLTLPTSDGAWMPWCCLGFLSVIPLAWGQDPTNFPACWGPRQTGHSWCCSRLVCFSSKHLEVFLPRFLPDIEKNLTEHPLGLLALVLGLVEQPRRRPTMFA